MGIIVEMFPANNGDCFLIRCWDNKMTNILVDLGYPSTYRNNFKKRLLDLKSENEDLNLVVFTHVDQDHIYGGITFFEENKESINPNIIRVEEVWHNSYKHLQIAESEELLTSQQKNKAKSLIKAIPSLEEKTSKIGARQGTHLAATLHKYEYPWNNTFGGNAVVFDKEVKIINDNVKLTIVSPTLNELEKLRKVWYRDLKRFLPKIPLTKDVYFDDAVEYLSFIRETEGFSECTTKTSNSLNLKKLASVDSSEDKDVINASSITFILECLNKKMLFLGDAPSSLIENQLNILFPNVTEPIYFDCIKIAHHGSANNTSESLMNLIDSNKYLISTNGMTHGHPDIETVARIVSRDTSVVRNIYFSHRTETSEFFDREELQEKYCYNVHYIEDNKLSLVINI